MNLNTYQDLWDTMVISDERSVTNAAKLILASSDEYKKLVDGTEVPYYFIGALHYRESSCNFTKHPHNGDSLNLRTIHVPSGRPINGTPPFTWIQSAKDCYFTLKGFDKLTSWTLPEMLQRAELFNGSGYIKYHPDTLSPYIWSHTNHYTSGKYASDGKFDPNLVDKQIGIAPIIRYLTDKTLMLV